MKALIRYSILVVTVVVITLCVFGSINRVPDIRSIEGGCVDEDAIVTIDGQLWHYSNRHISVGQMYQIVFNTMGTKNIRDDIIISYSEID